jgi:hypothetical protein
VLQADTEPAPPAGSRFIVLDESGYLGTLEVLPASWQVGPSCRSCRQWERTAIWEISPPRSPQGAITAVGPTTSSVPHARVLVEPSTALNDGSVGTIERAIDLDGDGRADLRRIRMRCAGDGTPDLRMSDYLCGHEHYAVETALLERGSWRVTERQVNPILPR